MLRSRQATVIPSAVIELARKAEEINPRQIRKKWIFNTAVVVSAIILVFIDLWVISQDLVKTDPGKRLAAFIAVGAIALLLVGLMSLLTLFISSFSYQRLNLLVEKAEKEEVVEETEALLDAVLYALGELEPESAREAFVKTLKRARPLEEHPALAQLVNQRIVL